MPGWLSGWVSAFGLGHDPGILGLSPTSSSLLGGETASPSPSDPPLLLLACSLCQINKILKKTINPLDWALHHLLHS